LIEGYAKPSFIYPSSYESNQIKSLQQPIQQPPQKDEQEQQQEQKPETFNKPF
jgi:hypothetical protein